VISSKKVKHFHLNLYNDSIAKPEVLEFSKNELKIGREEANAMTYFF
jgi:hypothetical protein